MRNDIKTFNDFIGDNNINESGVFKTSGAIQDSLRDYINNEVIPKSKGYVKNERDGAILLYDILSHLYNI